MGRIQDGEDFRDKSCQQSSISLQVQQLTMRRSCTLKVSRSRAGAALVRCSRALRSFGLPEHLCSTSYTCGSSSRTDCGRRTASNDEGCSTHQPVLCAVRKLKQQCTSRSNVRSLGKSGTACCFRTGFTVSPLAERRTWQFGGLCWRRRCQGDDGGRSTLQ